MTVDKSFTSSSTRGKTRHLIDPVSITRTNHHHPFEWTLRSPRQHHRYRNLSWNPSRLQLSIRNTIYQVRRGQSGENNINSISLNLPRNQSNPFAESFLKLKSHFSETWIQFPSSPLFAAATRSLLFPRPIISLLVAPLTAFGAIPGAATTAAAQC